MKIGIVEWLDPASEIYEIIEDGWEVRQEYDAYYMAHNEKAGRTLSALQSKLRYLSISKFSKTVLSSSDFLSSFALIFIGRKKAKLFLILIR